MNRKRKMGEKKKWAPQVARQIFEHDEKRENLDIMVDHGRRRPTVGTTNADDERVTRVTVSSSALIHSTLAIVSPLRLSQLFFF